MHETSICNDKRTFPLEKKICIFFFLFLAKLNVVSLPKGKVHFYMLEIFTERLRKNIVIVYFYLLISFSMQSEIETYSTIKSSKIMSRFLFFSSYAGEDASSHLVLPKLMPKASRQTSTPRAAVLLPHP